MHLLSKTINFNKNKTESKMGNPTHSFRETNLQLTKESQIKSKTVMCWTLWKKKKSIFCIVNFVRRNFFFNICVVSQCIVSWIHFRNIHTFTNMKALLRTLVLLVFKTVQSLHCILNLSSFELAFVTVLVNLICSCDQHKERHNYWLMIS